MAKSSHIGLLIGYKDIINKNRSSYNLDFCFLFLLSLNYQTPTMLKFICYIDLLSLPMANYIVYPVVNYKYPHQPNLGYLHSNHQIMTICILLKIKLSNSDLLPSNRDFRQAGYRHQHCGRKQEMTIFYTLFSII